MRKELLNIMAVELDTAWMDKSGNIRQVENLVAGYCEGVDIVVLPEMFATGFTFEAGQAEDDNGYIISEIKRLAEKYSVAVCGTFLACDIDGMYNRCFFITPDGSYHKYDKRHLFCLSMEYSELKPGKETLVFDYLGWNISLFVCYDLRFPVWMRNKGLKYDLAILPANWPEIRTFAWKHLSVARAIENQSYMIAVNRSGTDALGLGYSGDSLMLDYKGDNIAARCAPCLLKATLDYSCQSRFREKYQFWRDAD